jgi:hypothetical protein
MIQLAEDCLVFRTSGGDNIPYSAEMISVEIMGKHASLFDADFIKHAATAVLHYFRDELDRESVTVAEFTLALEKILRGFNIATAADAQSDQAAPRVLHSDLFRIATEAHDAGELFFFPRLRDELRAQLRHEPQMLCFRGLRKCVKQLAGARRWTPRCQSLQDQIVEFLRTCMTQENPRAHCALVVK